MIEQYHGDTGLNEVNIGGECYETYEVVAEFVRELREQNTDLKAEVDRLSFALSRIAAWTTRYVRSGCDVCKSAHLLSVKETEEGEG